jgi:peptide/nickel transport system permease protein
VAKADHPGNEMVRYIIRRRLWTVVVLIIVSFVTFLIFYVIPPGDPAVLRVGHFPNEQLLIHIRHALGLDKPFWVQYWIYMRGIVLHFNFGFSYQYEEPVVRLILNRLPATVSLSVGAVIVWLLIGLPIGIISAVKRRSVLDRALMGVALLAISMPVYWLGLMSLYLFANDIGVFHVFDGAGTYTGLTAAPIQWFNSLLLPWLVLAASFAAFYSRLLRANLIETMSEDYIRTARAKGLSERRVVLRHGARSAITLIVTVPGPGHGYAPGRGDPHRGCVQHPRGWPPGLRRHSQCGSAGDPGHGDAGGFLYRGSKSHRGHRLRIYRPTSPVLMSPLLGSNGAPGSNPPSGLAPLGTSRRGRRSLGSLVGWSVWITSTA